MADDFETKDENLRLIFSEEHSAWLKAKIAKTKRTIAILLALLVPSVVGLLSQMAEPRSGFFITSAVITAIVTIELIRHIIGLKKYRSYTDDHEAFLKKYNRR